MSMVFSRFFAALGIMFVVISSAPSAWADDIQITVTNEQQAGGFVLAPVFFGVQGNSSYSTFTAGSTASSAIASLAETGSTAALASQFTANTGSTMDTTLTSGGTLPQFLPGQSASTTLNIGSPTGSEYLSYAGMVVPSNDFFLGNQSALQIFDSSGHFVGPITINVYGTDVWNADSEQQSLTSALAFGANAQTATPGNGVQIANGSITHVLPGSEAFLNSIVGLPTAAGYDISQVYSSPEDSLVATITINDLSATGTVPEPSSILLFGTGVIAVIVQQRRMRSRKAKQLA
jgi:hypothetical protein